MKLHELLPKIVHYAHVKLIISESSEIICQKKISVMKWNGLYGDYEITYVYPINNEYIGIVVKKGD